MSITERDDYYEVASVAPAVLEIVEEALRHYGAGTEFSIGELLADLPAGIFRDQVRTVLRALAKVSVIRPESDDRFVVLPAAQDGAVSRAAIRDCLRWA